MFPFEKNSETAYYHKESNQKNSTGGVLYHKYHTITKRYKSLTIPSEGTADVNEFENVSNHFSEDVLQSEQTMLASEWLDINRCPTSELYDKLHQCWRQTACERKPGQELMSNWTHYKLPIGYTLIDIDFKFNFKKAKRFNSNVFKDFIEHDWEILKLEIKSPTYKKDIDNHLLLVNDGKYVILYE